MGTPAWIGLGSNLGDRKAQLDGAIAALASAPGVLLRAVSGYHETAPVGGPTGQPGYLNAAAALDTTQTPDALLHLLNQIEAQAGRVRDQRWGARTLDLDILLMGDLRLHTERLQVPHPRMAVRRFVLAPLAEIAPDAVDPLLHRTVSELLTNLDRRPSYVAIATEPQWDWRELVEELHAARGNPVLLAKHDPTSHALPPAVQLREQLEQALPAVAIESRISPADRLRVAETRLARRPTVPSLSDGETLVELATNWLDSSACASLVESDGWLVSHFWFDALFLSLDSLKSLRPRFPGFVRQFLEARQQVQPPTFVVASRADSTRLGLFDPRYDWRRPVGWDTPVITVDDLASEAAVNEVLAACAATRAG